ncbi:hypothetical protein B0J11DRAFT_571954 [Dendryphion nanum]|uniref:Zn(2)-C6 fungal-type domain-containing protein n=1 Tax=Dendryphion nanum TaxID=256645 RepID=A0A9P9DBS2_9PLEO|nr:hypothetical protein B0J11DRAFT_571954 [Dendryphion nanum]
MCPFTSFPEGEGPNRFSPSSVKDWQPRRKSVSNACERCRRRKIRCDGSTPCGTCSRFSLPCVRTQKTKEVLASEHQAMLESRIHQLESQLAAHVNSPMHGMEGIESIDSSLMSGSSSFDWQSPPPQLSLDTAFPAPFTPGQDMDLGSFSAGSIASLPSIAITECEHNPNISSPISPVPSFWSGTTRASSPELQPTSAPQYPPSLPMSARSQTFSPPAGLHGGESWEFLGQQDDGQLKPHAAHSQTFSRRTSVSSASLDSDEASEDLQPLAPIPRLPRQGIFSPRTESPISSGTPTASFTDRSRAMDAIPLPSRFEAETLTTEFVHFIDSISGPKPYSLSPAVFAKLCEAVYPEPGSRSSSVDNTLSQKVVRFHVFMAMAIGMKVRIRDSPEPSNALLDRCYELAMQQTSSAVFWQEQGSVEAAQLMSIFASIRKEVAVEPKPLQHAFSW